MRVCASRPLFDTAMALLLLCAICLPFCLSSLSNAATPSPIVNTSVPSRRRTIILDAGHGGEDGGAVSSSGALEKDLNLSLTLLLRDMLRANGIHVILTRESDALLYDRNVDFHGRKKALDLAARKTIAESTPNSLFVSIHMNT